MVGEAAMLAARGGGGGPRLVAWLLIGGGRVLIALIVGTDDANVERELKRGLLACPYCAGALRLGASPAGGCCGRGPHCTGCARGGVSAARAARLTCSCPARCCCVAATRSR